MPAGVVTVVDGTDWKMTGDNSDNALEVDVTDDFIVVTPLNGTRLKVGGFTYDPDEPVEFDGPPTVTRDAIVDLKGGHDSLLVRYSNYFYEGEIGRNVKVSMGAGDDRLLIQVESEVLVRGTTTFDLGAGNDSFFMEGGLGWDEDMAGITLKQALTVTGGAGHDVVSLSDFVANKSVKIDMGTENDTLALERVRIGTDWTVLLGSGNDQLLASDVGVTGKLRIDAGAGNDRCLLNSIALNRTSSVNLQAGNDAMSIVSPTLTAGAKLDLIGGTNTDIVQGDTSTTGITVKQFETVDTTNSDQFDGIRDSVFAKLDEARNGFWM